MKKAGPQPRPPEVLSTRQRPAPPPSPVAGPAGGVLGFGAVPLGPAPVGAAAVPDIVPPGA